MGLLFEAYVKGGWIMHLILVIGILALTFFIERVIVLFFRASVDKDRFMGDVQRAILAGDINSAVNYCNSRSSPLSNIVKAGLIAVMNRGKEDEVQTAMDVAALREVPTLERRTPFLALFGNVATLMGLLATISGLIISFGAVAGLDPSLKAAALAKGISEAMFGTAFGLIVAIPSLLGYALLTSRSQRLVDDIHEVSVGTLNLILQNREKFPSK